MNHLIPGKAMEVPSAETLRRLEALLGAKAERAALFPRHASVRFDPRLVGESSYGTHLRLIGEEDRLVLVVGEIERFPPALVEAMVENQVVSQGHIERGVYPSEYVAFGSPSSIIATTGSFQAYQSYVDGKAHIALFGEDHFRRYQEWGLDEFVADAAVAVPCYDDGFRQTAALLGLVVEEVKNRLIGLDPDPIPPSLRAASRPLFDSFGLIAAARHPLPLQRALVDFAGLALTHYVDLPRSYFSGELRSPSGLDSYAVDRFVKGASPNLYRLLFSIDATFLEAYRDHLADIPFSFPSKGFSA